MTNAQEIIQEYVEQHSEAMTKLEALNKEADQHKELLRACSNAEQRIAESRERIAELETKRDALFEQYQRANFNGEKGKLSHISKERNAIDAELTNLNKSIDQDESFIEDNPLDLKKIDQLKDEIHAIEHPDIRGFYNRLIAVWQEDKQRAEQAKSDAVGELGSLHYTDPEVEEQRQRERAEKERLQAEIAAAGGADMYYAMQRRKDASERSAELHRANKQLGMDRIDYERYVSAGGERV